MAQAFESLASSTVRSRLSSVIGAKKPNVTATYASLTVRISLFKSWLIVAHWCLANVGRRRRRYGQ